MRNLIEKDFTFEVIETFNHHQVSFSIEENYSNKKIEGYLKAIIITGLRNSNGVYSDYRLVLAFLDNPEKLFYLEPNKICTKIKLQSGNKIEVNDLFDKQIVEKINSGFYNEKTKENKPVRNSYDLIIWSDATPLKIAYPYKGGIRELLLDSVSYKASTGALYFSCFCLMRKSTRTFRSDTFNDEIIYENNTYSLQEFLTDVLMLSIADLSKVMAEFDVQMGFAPAK